MEIKSRTFKYCTHSLIVSLGLKNAFKNNSNTKNNFVFTKLTFKIFFLFILGLKTRIRMGDTYRKPRQANNSRKVEESCIKTREKHISILTWFNYMLLFFKSLFKTTLSVRSLQGIEPATWAMCPWPGTLQSAGRASIH